MNKKRFANVWDAIEDTPEEAENMKLRASLMMALTDQIGREGLTQSEAAKLLGVTEPRISDLVRGKIELFAIDALVGLSRESLYKALGENGNPSFATILKVAKALGVRLHAKPV